MKILVALMVLSSAAFADKSYNEGKGATWDCAKDPVVSIQANDGKYTFKGACKGVSVNGNNNQITLETTALLSVNGNKNTIDAATADALLVTGNENKVTAKKKPSTLSNTGNNNKLSVPR
ncbi:MAG: DUF3060 domain-containing protein [Kofleriaceae bacterium]